MIKNILKSKNDEKCIFLHDNAEFSEDMKKYIVDNDVLIFKSVNPVNCDCEGIGINSSQWEEQEYEKKGEKNKEVFSQIDLAVLGDYKNNKNNKNNVYISDLDKMKTFILNIENVDIAEMTENLKNMNLTDIQIITCGLKEKDTIIFSSINIDENSVILNLQRSISNIKGCDVEPFEKKIIIGEAIKRDTTNEDLIFALATLLFCGRL